MTHHSAPSMVRPANEHPAPRSGPSLRSLCRSGQAGGARTVAGVARPLARPADFLPPGAAEAPFACSAPAGWGRHGGRTGRTCRRARRRPIPRRFAALSVTRSRWMCRRHGIGPGHKDWPEVSRAIVAFGGSLEGFRAGAPAVRAAMVGQPRRHAGHDLPGFGAPAAAPTSLLQRQAVANAPPPAPNAVQAEAAHARLPASWLPASGRQVFARAGPGPSTGPPRCPGLPTLSCLTHGAGAWPAPPS